MSSHDVLDLLGIEISPARMKCAMLSLETLQQALAHTNGSKAETSVSEPVAAKEPSR